MCGIVGIVNFKEEKASLIVEEDAELQMKVSENLRKLNFANKTSYEIVQAWNGKEDGVPPGYDVYNKWKIKDSWNSWWKRDVLPGEVGCMVSHIKLWERIVKEGIEKT